MKHASISELQDFIEQIDQLNLSLNYEIFRSVLDRVYGLMSNSGTAVHPKKHAAATSEINRAFDNQYSSLVDCVNDLRAACNEMIRHKEQQYLDDSMALWSTGVRYENAEVVFARHSGFDENDREMFASRIKLSSDWRLPAAIIRPGRESWQTCTTAFDPLYILDLDDTLLLPSRQMFNDTYQSMLQYRTFTESDQEQILSSLPENQLGFVLAFNFFDYRPLPIIKRYLNEIWTKLRPGGRVLFTFNDCDVSDNTKLFEKHKFMCYTPRRLLRDIYEKIGFIELEYHKSHTNCAWLMLSRPGEIFSYKGGQTLQTVVDLSK